MSNKEGINNIVDLMERRADNIDLVVDIYEIIFSIRVEYFHNAQA